VTTDTFPVRAHAMRVATPVWVEAGDTLSFQASGTWVDAVVRCSADGYDGSVFYALGQVPRIPDGGRYFRLMGRVVPGGAQPATDDIAATFPIGTASNRACPEAGRLFVFVNDKAGFHWNDRGAIVLTVARTPAA